MAETKIDQALMDLIDIELAKPARCSLYCDYGFYWRSEWSDSNGVVIRRESFDDVVGYGIELPRINVSIAPEYSDEHHQMQKVLIMSECDITDKFLSWKVNRDEEKEEDY